ncbi:hemerythrin domain-containing protein [Nocardioides sp. SYSU DS0651]|uniref:hemerythrin domain-containing protein n=1 Tax=Nocardioides sp. SYSU DS0651 TaxID=3415955 RepID=UPI003F4BEBCC
MCEHCGCRGVEPIAQLMDEHFELMELSARVRRSLAESDRHRTLALLRELRAQLGPHARREEAGLFAALRATGEYVEVLDRLEGDHRQFGVVLDGLDPSAADFADLVRELLDELADHIDQENLGIFPVAVVTLGADGWAQVDAAHAGRHAHDHPHQHAHHVPVPPTGGHPVEEGRVPWTAPR